MAIKVVALDVYGTIVSNKDRGFPPREGLADLSEFCRKRDIKIVTSSDMDIKYVKAHLEELKIDLGIFDNFFCLPEIPKEFFYVEAHYHISGNELLVVGDDEELDIQGARSNYAKYVLVKRYSDLSDGEKFDFMSLRNAIEAADNAGLIGRLDFDLTRFAVPLPAMRNGRTE